MNQRVEWTEETKQNATEMIQQAIIECRDSGGGRVIVKPGIYVCGTIHLEEQVVLWLEEGAVLLGSGEIEDYSDNETCFTDAVGHVRGKALIYAYQKNGVGIDGPGMINGRGYLYSEDHPAHKIRPFLVRLVECKDVVIKQTTFCNASAWCIHLQDCETVLIKQVKIHSRCNGNNDGIDMDGCQDVEVTGCVIDSGDDAICLKSTSGRSCGRIQISDCTVTSRWAGFKIGTESVGDFFDITVENCRFFDVEGGAVKILPVDGGNVNHVVIRNVEMISCTGPIFISNGTRLRRYLTVKKEHPGYIRDIRLESITAMVKAAKGGWYQGKVWGNAQGGVVLSGLEEYPICGVTIKKCHFFMPGGMKEKIEKEVPPMGDQYPEFHLFDPLPAWGMYQRDTRDVTVEETEWVAKEKDIRPIMVKEECNKETGNREETENEI